MELAIGFASGVVVCAASIISLLIVATGRETRKEWEERRKIQHDVQDLMRKFACGQGYVGCSGGPNCDWDHK